LTHLFSQDTLEIAPMSDSGTKPGMIDLTCTVCGTKLRVSNEIDSFACIGCGAEFMVQRTGVVISIRPVTEDLNDTVQNQRIASELTITRLEEEIAVDQAQLEERREQYAGEVAVMAHKMPGSMFYIVDAALAALGVFMIFNVDTMNRIIGVVLLAVAAVLLAYGLLQFRRITTAWSALLDDQQTELIAAQANITDKQAQLDALLHELA
jgi:hypothetical protein